MTTLEPSCTGGPISGTASRDLREGMRLEINLTDGTKKGLVWRMQSDKVEVAHDDLSCRVYDMTELLLHARSDETDTAQSMAAVLLDRVARQTKPCGFLYRPCSSNSEDGWQMFWHYRPSFGAADGGCYEPPVFSELQHGNQVNVLEKLIPVRKRSGGRPSAADWGATRLLLALRRHRPAILGLCISVGALAGQYDAGSSPRRHAALLRRLACATSPSAADCVVNG